MTTTEKLEALVDYARKHDQYQLLKGCEVRTRTANGGQEVYIIQTLGVDKQFIRELAWQQIVYNHEIAKALWQGKDPEFWHLKGQTSGRDANGSKQVLEDVTGEPFIPAWQYHLQQAVISKDPIDYFYRAVFGNE